MPVQIAIHQFAGDDGIQKKIAAIGRKGGVWVEHRQRIAHLHRKIVKQILVDKAAIDLGKIHFAVGHLFAQQESPGNIMVAIKDFVGVPVCHGIAIGIIHIRQTPKIAGGELPFVGGVQQRFVGLGSNRERCGKN